MSPKCLLSDSMNRKKTKGANPFSKILRDLIKEKGLTVRETAKLAGVSPSTLDDWRAGALPADYIAVKKLAKELGVSFSFLLTGEEDSKLKEIQPTITEVFDDGGSLFDGYAKITIQRLVPRKKDD